jgi:large subunit ribosomal protein L17
MLANLVCSLIKHKRLTTTLAKAKALRPLAEKMVTFGKGGSLHDRRLVSARLKFQRIKMHSSHEENVKWRQDEDVIRILFDEIAPSMQGRSGGYTRIIHMPGRRRGDAGETAIIEWVDSAAPAKEKAEPKASAPEKAEEAPSTEAASE